MRCWGLRFGVVRELGLGVKSEMEKMLAGELYNGADAELKAARMRCRELVAAFNAVAPLDEAGRARIAGELIGKMGKNFFCEPPFRCDYGRNIEIGDNVTVNFNCVILDCARVKIGNGVLVAPGVQIFTAYHPLEAKRRREHVELEYASEITIGDNVWIGGGAIICPGVRIGNDSVIGAGSVVTRDIPAGVVAVGNPCRVLRKLPV